MRDESGLENKPSYSHINSKSTILQSTSRNMIRENTPLPMKKTNNGNFTGGNNGYLLKKDDSFLVGDDDLMQMINTNRISNRG
jgi:hypothetical protein